MNTKLLLSASAIFLGAFGIAGTFAPHEMLAWAGTPASGITPLLMQLLGALLFAFAMVNWAARGSLIGGIYNRPVAIGNLTHFLIGAISLAKAVAAGQRQTLVIILAIGYALFAVAFSVVFFRSPVTTPADGRPGTPTQH
jgi:hypothetical protein